MVTQATALRSAYDARRVMVSAIATSASTLGISLPSAIVFTALVAAAGLATRGVWKAMPGDKSHDSRLRYVPAAFFVASLPATVSIGSFDIGIWCDLLGADVQFQPVHFLLLLIGALSAVSGFVWGGLMFSVGIARKPQVLIPPWMRK